MTTHIMSFGKHKGQPITEVPGKDLEFYANWDKIRPEQLAAIQAELARRTSKVAAATGPTSTKAEWIPTPAPPVPTGATPARSARALDIIALGQRTLAGLPYTHDAAEWLVSLVAAADHDTAVPF